MFVCFVLSCWFCGKLMKEILSFSWENMEMLLLDEAFRYVSHTYFGGSTKLFSCAVASFHMGKELQHFANSIHKVTACLAERHSVYLTPLIGPKIFTTMREKYSPGFIYLYFKTNLKDTYSCFVWRLWCDNFALLWIGLVFDIKKKKKKNGCSIWQYPISSKVCLCSMKLLLLDPGRMHHQNIMLTYCIKYVC